MDANQQNWIRAVAQAHGEKVSGACERILRREIDQKREEPSLIYILKQAEQEVHQDQISAACATRVSCFSSDADL